MVNKKIKKAVAYLGAAAILAGTGCLASRVNQAASQKPRQELSDVVNKSDAEEQTIYEKFRMDPLYFFVDRTLQTEIDGLYKEKNVRISYNRSTSNDGLVYFNPKIEYKSGGKGVRNVEAYIFGYKLNDPSTFVPIKLRGGKIVRYIRTITNEDGKFNVQFHPEEGVFYKAWIKEKDDYLPVLIQPSVRAFKTGSMPRGADVSDKISFGDD